MGRIVIDSMAVHRDTGREKLRETSEAHIWERAQRDGNQQPDGDVTDTCLLAIPDSEDVLVGKDLQAENE